MALNDIKVAINYEKRRLSLYWGLKNIFQIRTPSNGIFQKKRGSAMKVKLICSGISISKNSKGKPLNRRKILKNWNKPNNESNTLIKSITL